LAAALLVAALIAGPFTSGGAAAPEPTMADILCPAQQGGGHGDWASMKGPVFPEAQQEISEHAIDTQLPNLVFATNGTTVMRSFDFGCTWALSYSLPELPEPPTTYSRQDSEIIAIRMIGPGSVYLGVQQRGAAPQPHVLRSDDVGDSWTAADGGELAGAVGQLRDLVVPLADRATAYALVDASSADGPVTAGVAQMLYATEDSGSFWELRSTFAQPGVAIEIPGVPVVETPPNLTFSRLAVDPARPDEPWMYGAAGLQRSEDGGRSFTDTELGAVSFVQIARAAAGGPGRVLAFGPDPGVVRLSEDGGRSFSPPQPGPAGVDSGGHGAAPDDTVVGAGGRVFLQLPPAPGAAIAWDQVDTQERSIVDIEVGLPVIPYGAPLTVVGRTDSTIEVTNFPDFPEYPLLDEIHIDGGDLADLGAGVLHPRSARLVLSPGQKKTIDYELALPPTPTPLDVFFLIDVSSSMDDAINGVRHAMQEIVDRLHGLGINVHFGVGIYRAFSDPPAYERVRDIGPVDDGLARALNSISSRGGGDETQLYALQRSVTDQGTVLGSHDPPFNFRRGSLRVAINATDEPFSTGPPHPNYAEVIAALNLEEVKQVGLAIQEERFPGGRNDDRGEPAEGLLRIARGTGTVAPITGVDCDGDGATDISPAAPIVCAIPPGRSNEAGLMADAIVNVLHAVQDINTLSAVAYSPSVGPQGEPPEVVSKVSPGELTGVDLKESNRLPFSVEFRCPRLDRPTTFPIEVAVLDSGRKLGRAAVTVVCRVPAAPGDPVPVAAAFVPLVSLPLPPPRPPDPVTNPNPNPQPNPQPHPQAQAGFASQEQEQPQVAVAHQEAQVAPHPEDAADQYLMTRHVEKSGPSPGAIWLGSAVTMTLVYGFAMLRREQLRTQHARRRGR
jgi:hypothetical protein